MKYLMRYDYKPKANMTTVNKRNNISPMGDICNKANKSEKRYGVNLNS